MTYYTYNFKWPNTDSGVNTVQITGNFDNWQRTTDILVKEAEGFSGNIKVQEKQDLIFKFIINNNEWRVSNDYKIQMDSSGIENNIVLADELIAVEEIEHDDNIKSHTVDTAVEGEGHVSEFGVSEAEAIPEAIPEADKDVSEIVRSESPTVEGKKLEISNPENDNPETIQETTVKTIENDEDKDLSQVLTSTSSFAAVSIPDTRANIIDEEMEQLDDNYEEDDYDEDDDEDEDDFVLSKEKYEIPDGEGEIDDQYNTPTTSAANSVIPSSSKSKKISLGNTNAESKPSSPIKDHGKGLRVPGAFPNLSDTGNKISLPEVKSPGRREGLISKFKSLFRY